MNAGVLNNIITIQEPTVIQNEFGANAIEWTDLITTRAQVTYNSGSRVNENNEVIFNYEKIFTIRVYHQINERMRIIWEGKKYRILSIEEDKHKQKLTIRTELINE